MVKRVLVVVKHLIYGGTEKYTLNLVNSLIKRGISVVVVTNGGPLTEHLHSKAKVFVTPISRKPRIKEISEEVILKVAKKYKVQLIHTQCRTSMINSQKARKLLHIPLITHEHHMYADERDYPFIVKELDDNSDKILTIGPFTARKLKRFGIPKEKVHTILNGVDVSVPVISSEERIVAREKLQLHSTDKVAVCLSRIENGKGLDKLIRAFTSLSEKIPNAKLIIAGDEQGNLIIPQFKELIKQHGLQKRIFIYPGEYNIRKYHAVADVFCYPAICKGMSVMEAMAVGLPIVGRKTTRKPLAVEHMVSGLMTESTKKYKIDPDQIAEKLLYLFENPSAAKRMGKNARKRIEEKFNLDETITKILHFYNKTVDEHIRLPEESIPYLYPLFVD